MMEALTSSSQSFGGLILMKSTLLLGLVFLASLVFRRASAATQHYLWTLAYVALVTLPVVSSLSMANGSWRIEVPVLPTSETVPRSTLDTAESSSVPSAVPETPPTTHNASRVWPSMWQLAWFMGGAVFMIRLIVGIAAGRRTKRQAQELKDETWLDLLGDAQARIGALGDVELRTTSTSQLPMTIGVRHPTILLPRAASEYSAQRRWAVLLHELAHIRRRDCLTQLVCQVACVVFWWHPLAWIGARKMRALSERASDDLVLHAGATPSEYAHDLLDMARGLNLQRASAPIASVAMAHRSRLEDRLLAILDPAMARRAMTSRIKLPATLFGLAILVSVALAVPSVAVSQRLIESQAQERDRDDDDDDDDDGDERKELSEAQEKAREALAEAVNDSDASVRGEALDALVRLGDERSVPYLVEALSSSDADARAEAAWGLGQMRHREAVDDLIDALADENADVRSQAAWALGMIRDPRALAGLSQALQDDDVDVREEAIWAVGMLRSPDSLDILVVALSDTSADIREQAAWALGMLGDERAVDALSQALKDADADVREQAAWALGKIARNGDDDIDLDLDLDLDVEMEIDSGDPSPNPQGAVF